MKYPERPTTQAELLDPPKGAILTYSGYWFWPLKARGVVSIVDIAHHLSQINRFTGATSVPYSVAQHSWYVSHLCAPEDDLEGLLHEGDEPYLNDISSPVKHSPQFAAGRRAAGRLQRLVYRTFACGPREPDSVRWADREMLRFEQYHLMSRPSGPYYPKPQGPFWYRDIFQNFEPWSAREAEHMFLKRFHELTDARSRREGRCVVRDQRGLGHPCLLPPARNNLCKVHGVVRT